MNEVLAGIAGLLDMTEAVLWQAVLVFVRMGALVALLPAIGEQTVPQRVKLAVVIVLTMTVTPLIADGPYRPEADPGLAALAVEAVSGLIIGIGLRLFVLALITAGSIIAQATTLSQLFAGAAPEPQPAIGNLLIIAGLAIAVSAGLHVRVVELVVQSYAILPQGRLPSPAEVADWGLSKIAATFRLSFALAAPFVIASMIYNLALGAINRAMPQLMVSFVGAPALTLGALAMLAVTTPLLLEVWHQALLGHLREPFAVVP
ncbi:MAG: flagellar biosynthetic protein FliR [Tabrizicola sp.]|nr:flagellar biosynthetic protein FliR [Tabrizicola sp.]